MDLYDAILGKRKSGERSDRQYAAGVVDAFLMRGLRARSRAMIRATMPSIRSMLFFFDGFQLSAASFSMLTLPAIQRSTGWPACPILPPRTNSSSF